VYEVIYNLLYIFTISISFIIIAYNISLYKIKRGCYLYIFINTLIDMYFIENGKYFLLFPITTIVLAYFIYINFKKLAYSIFILILTDLIFAVSDAIIGLLSVLFFHVDFNAISKQSVGYFVVAIGIAIISYIISDILRRLFLKAYNYDELTERLNTNLPIIFYTSFAMIIIYADICVYKYVIKMVNTLVIILNAVIIISHFIIFIILVYLNNKYIKVKLHQQYKDQELKQMKNHTDMVESMFDDLRRFKHDYINILLVLGSYIESNNIRELELFYKNQLMPKSMQVINKDISLCLLKNLKISSLKGLIASKIYSANLKNIITYIEIPEEISSLSINELDMCRIIGILFDNAIEAATLCDKKVIHFAAIKKEEYISFIINNTCTKDTPHIHEIYKDGFSTKGSGRGIGLNTIRNIIDDRYTNACLHTKIEDCVFKQELIILQLN
jgi:two-component system sensor histidine kinase AgrC